MFKKLIEKLRRRPKKVKTQSVKQIEIVKELEPHEKAALGQGTWGRQKAEPIGIISARVIRKDGTIEELGIISGGK